MLSETPSYSPGIGAGFVKDKDAAKP